MSSNKSTSALPPQQHPKNNKKKRSVIQDSYFTNHHSSPKSTPTTPSSPSLHHTNHHHDDDNNNNNSNNNNNDITNNNNNHVKVIVVDPILTILQQQFNEFIDDSVIELIYSNHELSFNEKLFHLTEMVTTSNNNVNHSPSYTTSEASQEEDNTHNNNNNNTNNKSNEISFLYDMFILPQQQQQQENEEHVFDRELIQIVLEENKNDIYATMNQLLQMNNGSDTLLDVVVDDVDDNDEFEMDDDNFLNEDDDDDSSNMYDTMMVEQQTIASIVASPQKKQQQGNNNNNNNKKQQKKKKNQQQQRKEQKKLQHAETIERLSEIFTRVDRDTIEATLIGHDNNADEAFRALSVMSPFLTMDHMSEKKKKQELKSKKNQSFRNADEYFGRKQGLVFNQWNSASISGGSSGGSSGTNNNSTKNVNNGLNNRGMGTSAKSYSIEEEPLTELDHLPSNQNTHLSLSDELKLEKLCSMFKDYDVGDDIVKNVFISCKCHFGLTIQRLYDLYPNVDSARRSAQNIIAPKMLQHVKQQQQQKRSNQNQRQSTSSTFVNYDNSLKNDDYMSQVIDERVFINDDDPYNSSMHRRTGVQFAKIRNQFFTMALEAYMRGDGASAKELAEKGRKADRISKAAHMNASYSIFNHVNANKQSRELHTKTIDLHGLHVSEALQILGQIIQSEKQELERDERNVRTLNVITGVGRNSTKGKARVKPAVEAFLKREGYRIKTLSPGDLQITIKK